MPEKVFFRPLGPLGGGTEDGETEKISPYGIIGHWPLPKNRKPSVLDAFGAAAPKGQCPMEHRVEFPYVHSSIRPYIPPQARSLNPAYRDHKSTQWSLESALSGMKPALLDLKSALSSLKSALSGLKSAFWAAVPKGTKSCRTQGNFRSSIRPFVRSSPPGPLRPEICLIRPEICPIRPEIYPLRPEICPLKP